MDTNTPNTKSLSLNSEATIEELLEMDLARIEAMSPEDILAYLKPCLEVQPPVNKETFSAAQPGSKVKLGSTPKGLSRGQIAQKLVNRGPKIGESNILALLANVAKETGQDFDPDAVLKHMKK